jgi:hypothetical protein
MIRELQSSSKCDGAMSSKPLYIQADIDSRAPNHHQYDGAMNSEQLYIQADIDSTAPNHYQYDGAMSSKP